MVVDLCSCSALGNYSLFFLFYSTGFVRPSLSRLRPNQMPKYMLLKSRRSFACSGVWIRTRAQCLGSVVALIWWRRGITAWHTLVSCTRFFLPKVPKRETKKKILTWFLFLFFCPATLTLAKLSCVSSVRRLMLSLSCPVPSLTLANPTLLQLLPLAPLPLLLLCLPFSGSVF